MTAPIRMAGPERPTALHATTPTMDTTTATMLSRLIFWLQSRQMKIEVMAKEAMASGTEMALPTSAPTTFESVQLDCESRFTSSARRTVHSPSWKCAMFTP